MSEETGINGLQSPKETPFDSFVLNQKLIPIFDIDIHMIPEATKNGIIEPKHWHFDIRYLLVAPENTIIQPNMEETGGFKWKNLYDTQDFINTSSMLRLFEKAQKYVETQKNKFKKNFSM